MCSKVFLVVSEFGFIHKKKTLVWFSQFPALLEKLRKLHVLLIVLAYAEISNLYLAD